MAITRGFVREGESYAGRMPDSPLPPADLGLRLVRCFTVVAEHRHFGRTSGPYGDVPGAGRQHRRGRAVLRVVGQRTVAEPVERPALQVVDVLGAGEGSVTGGG
jgi:hypothetical protein